MTSNDGGNASHHGNVLIFGSDPSQNAAGVALARTGVGLDEGISTSLINRAEVWF